MSRFAGLYIPILDFPFNGPAATDTEFDAVVINRQYDGFVDFPLYPLNVVADLNAVLGILYLHTTMIDVSLASDASGSTPITTMHGDTTYYIFPTKDLPLFGPLRTLGVPEPVIDVFEPFFREVVELGYDRSIEPWESTPARLIPRLDPATVAANFADSIEEGIDNARVLVAAQTSSKTSAVSPNTDAQEAELQTNESVGALKSDVDGRTTLNLPGHDNRSTPLATGHTRPTPLRDVARNLSSGIKKVVADVSDGIKKAIRVGDHAVKKGPRDIDERQG